MRFEPCVQCMRHVDVDVDICPFCDAAVVPPVPRVFNAGRFSRAAVIAGAALGGCYTTSQPQQATVPDPQEQRTQQEQASPPPDDRFAKPPVGSGTIRGVVVDGASRSPIQGVVVYAYSQQGGNPLQTKTDADGRYEFRDVAAGTYSIAFTAPSRPNARRWEEAMAPSKRVTVTNGGVAQADSEVAYTIHSPPPPYGAPPPRRRVV